MARIAGRACTHLGPREGVGVASLRADRAVLRRTGPTEGAPSFRNGAHTLKPPARPSLLILLAFPLAVATAPALADVIPYHVSIDVTGLTNLEMEFALYDNSGVIGDSWALLDNVTLGGLSVDFEGGTLGGFDYFEGLARDFHARRPYPLGTWRLRRFVARWGRVETGLDQFQSGICRQRQCHCRQRPRRRHPRGRRGLGGDRLRNLWRVFEQRRGGGLH